MAGTSLLNSTVQSDSFPLPSYPLSVPTTMTVLSNFSIASGLQHFLRFSLLWMNLTILRDSGLAFYKMSLNLGLFEVC